MDDGAGADGSGSAGGSARAARGARGDLVAFLDERFAAIAGWSFDHRAWVLAGFALLLAASVVLAGRARIDNSYEAYFDPDDPAYLAYEQYRQDFGSDEISYILYEAPGFEHGPWNLEVMQRIAQLTEVLEDEVPFVYEVESLANAELLEGSAEGIHIRRLRDAFPKTQAELLALRERYLARPMLVGGLLSADARHAAIVIEMDRSSTDPPEAIRLDPERGDALDNLYPQVTNAAIEAILARPEYAGITFHHTGDVPLNAFYNEIIAQESGTLDLLASLVIGSILLVAFRSFVAAVAPLVVVQASVILTVAFIAALGWKLDMSFGSMPTLITAIGVAHSVHVLSGFRARFSEIGDRREALVGTFRRVGTPCLLTSLTTAAGFASMSLTPIKSIAHSGVYSAFGVMAAFVMSLTLLMALLSFGRRTPRTAAAGGAAVARGEALRERRRRALEALARFDVRNRRAILLGFAALAAISVAGMTRLVVDSNWLDDFSDDVPLKATTQLVDRVMGGTTNVIYLFDAGAPEAIKEPSALREIERVQALAEAHGGIVRKTYSIVDVLKDLNQAFHEGDPAWHRLPATRELVAQYLLLYETSGGEDADEFLSSDYRRASLELRLALAMTSETAALVQEIGADLDREPLRATRVELTGIGALWLELLDYIVSSQIQSFLLAFTVVGALMVLVFRSFRVGLLSMLPNLAPVAFTLGVMGWAEIPLDYSKMMIAAVAIGIAVDDTIHLVLRYRHEFQRYGDYALALQAALQDVGRALLLTSLALVAGFLVFTLSVMDSQAMYGILLATTITTALVADFLLLPALILSFHPFGPERRGPGAEALREAA